MIRKTKRSATLSDKIAGILTTAPGNFDPEDDIYEETTAKVSSREDDDEVESDEVDEATALSNFRRRNVDLLEDIDQRYVGKKGSRQSLKDDDWETEDEGLSTDEGEALDGEEGTREMLSEDEESEGDEEESEGDEEFEEDDGKLEDDTNFKHISDTTSPGQLKKGNCVRNQLNLWENLLETRIQLQKCLLTSNKLPQFDQFKQFEDNRDFKQASTKTKKSITNCLDKLLSLQFLLLKQFKETKSLLSDGPKPEESDEEIPSDTDEEESTTKSDNEDDEVPNKKRRKLEEYETEINTRHEKYRDYRNTTIQKWNDKTRVSIGKNTAGNNILQHINFILDDKTKLIKRTQLKRSEYKIIGKTNTDAAESLNPTENYDAEIYDDDDFYHQLLRELIEFKSADVTDPVQMSRQWIQLQNLRSKMKRKIDTKATKGRKIRYAVHSKLVNFMASIDECTLTDEAKNELYSSLFGNNKYTKNNF